MNDTNPVLGISQAARSWLYLGGFVGATTLTPIVMAIDGTAKVIVGAVLGACGAITGLLGAVATRKTTP